MDQTGSVRPLNTIPNLLSLSEIQGGVDPVRVGRDTGFVQ